MRYIKISQTDIANGVGVRVVLWLSGCSHRCEGCHNPETWSPMAGEPFNEEAKKELFEALDKPYIAGITFSGGDPMHENNRVEVTALAKEIKQRFPSKNVWLYTGYTWEELDSINPEIKNVVDVIVDGEFKKQLYSISLKWRGSSNQRVIDCKTGKEIAPIE